MSFRNVTVVFLITQSSLLGDTRVVSLVGNAQYWNIRFRCRIECRKHTNVFHFLSFRRDGTSSFIRKYYDLSFYRFNWFGIIIIHCCLMVSYPRKHPLKYASTGHLSWQRFVNSIKKTNVEQTYFCRCAFLLPYIPHGVSGRRIACVYWSELTFSTSCFWNRTHMLHITKKHETFGKLINMYLLDELRQYHLFMFLIHWRKISYRCMYRYLGTSLNNIIPNITVVVPRNVSLYHDDSIYTLKYVP